ncbi:MAG TPA: hypothetical protein VF641_10275, partial [Methylobacterium sp.]
MASIVAALFWIAPASAARLVSIKGMQADRYGRIALTFDGTVAVKARVSGSVLIITYGERSASGSERIALEMPDYVSAVRRDPDSTGMRIALTRPYRVNVQAAAEHVFVDLLPDGWSGLTPPVPPEIVAEIARRAQAAEAALRAATPPAEPKRLALELSQLPTLTRLSLRLPREALPRFESVGAATQVAVPGAWRIDDIGARGRTKPAIEALTVEADAEVARLLVTPAAGYEIRTWRDDDGVTLDVARTQADDKAAPAKARPIPGAAPAAFQAEQPLAAVRPDAQAKAIAAPSPRERILRPEGPGLVF